MNQAIAAETHAEGRMAKSAALDGAKPIRRARPAEPKGPPPRSAEAAVLAFDADAVLFELGVAGPQWSYDGLRPQLRFSFEGGHATAAIRAAPARNASCAPGSFALLSPGVPVSLSYAAPLEILALTFGPEALASRTDPSPEVAAFDGEGPIPITDQGVRALAAEVRRALIEEPRPDRGYMAALGKAMLVRALSVINEGASSRAGKALSPFRLRRVIDHIEANLDSRITVQDLAERAQLSTAHFTRAFRQATGEAPHRFILIRRVARARELLRDPALCLTTVALRAGFSSHAHMCSVFRRLRGLAPAAYRADVGARRAG